MDNCPACKREFKGIEDFHEGVLDLPSTGSGPSSNELLNDPDG